MTGSHQQLMPPPYTLSPEHRPAIYQSSTTPYENLNPRPVLLIQGHPIYREPPPSYAEAVSCDAEEYQSHHQPLNLTCSISEQNNPRQLELQENSIYNNAKYDVEFRDYFIRKTYLRQVYGLLTCQMGFIFSFIKILSILWMNSIDLKISLVTVGVILIMGALIFIHKTREIPYLNTVAVICVSLGFTMLGTFISYYYKSDWPPEAAALTACVSLSMAVFATECFWSIILCMVIVPTLSLTLWCVCTYCTWVTHSTSVAWDLIYASIAAILVITYVSLTVITTLTLNENGISHTDINFTLLSIFRNIFTMWIEFLYRELNE